jgi:hypothetical protein
MKTESAHAISTTIAIGALAGAAGGLAEIVWIGSYAALTGVDAAGVARGVTDSVGLGDLIAFPVTAGIVIHMMLAGMLGIAIALALGSIVRIPRGAVGLYTLVLTILAAVWAINFFAVLPQINPRFVQVVPYGASLVSKLLFGVAAAWFFHWARSVRPSLVPAEWARRRPIGDV